MDDDYVQPKRKRKGKKGGKQVEFNYPENKVLLSDLVTKQLGIKEEENIFQKLEKEISNTEEPIA